ncbi:hypothetical protein [Schnuerera sp.]|nr:hypothetical protein [Schnuerera sp.]HSH36491.1 hypothetical protein [Schnuerera sp.]
MIDKIIRSIITLIGLLVGYGIVAGLKALEIVSLSNKGCPDGDRQPELA